MQPSRETLAKRAAQEAEDARCLAETLARRHQMQEASNLPKTEFVDRNAEKMALEAGIDLGRIRDEFLNLGNSTELEAVIKCYEAVRPFLRILAKNVPLPNDYAEVWMMRNSSRLEPRGQRRLRNHGDQEVPYAESAMTLAFAWLHYKISHAQISSGDEQVLFKACEDSVQFALLAEMEIQDSDLSYIRNIRDKKINEIYKFNSVKSPHSMKVRESKVLAQLTKSLALSEEKLPPRPKTEFRELMEQIDNFVRLNPKRAVRFLKHCTAIVDRHRPLGTTRVLKVRDAVRITGLSETRIYQLTEEENLGEKVGKRWRFSEAELHKAAQKERKVGRPSRLDES